MKPTFVNEFHPKNKKKARRIGLALFVLGSSLFVLLGFYFEPRVQGSMIDFKGLYYSGGCFLQGCDPYDAVALNSFYLANDREASTESRELQRIVVMYVNLPTTLVYTSPFALFSWGMAHLLWMTLTACLFVLACGLTWEASGSSPGVAGGMTALMLLGSVMLLIVGNAAGIEVSLSVIAVWCVWRNRFAFLGVACLALSVLIKPQNADFIWVYFVLSGGQYRRRAWQALAVGILLSLLPVTWLTYRAPNWVAEQQRNFAAISSHGDMNDPGPSSPNFPGIDTPIDLQTSLSIVRDDAKFYDAATYLICAPLLAIWLFITIRARRSSGSTWFALASLAAIALLPVYHRQHDGKLLLLSIPACAMLWAERGVVGWCALLISSTAIVLVGDVPSIIRNRVMEPLLSSTTGTMQRLLTASLGRPVPLILLLMGCFYLWAYSRHALDRSFTCVSGDSEGTAPREGEGN